MSRERTLELSKSLCLSHFSICRYFSCDKGTTAERSRPAESIKESITAGKKSCEGAAGGGRRGTRSRGDVAGSAESLKIFQLSRLLQYGASLSAQRFRECQSARANGGRRVPASLSSAGDC